MLWNFLDEWPTSSLLGLQTHIMDAMIEEHFLLYMVIWLLSLEEIGKAKTIDPQLLG